MLFRSFITLRIVKLLGDRIRGVLLYSFIVKSHTEDCTHIYKNQYKLIIVTLFRDRVIYLLQKLCVHLYVIFYN